MSNTVDWAYLKSGFGSPMPTPQQEIGVNNAQRAGPYGAPLVAASTDNAGAFTQGEPTSDAYAAQPAPSGNATVTPSISMAAVVNSPQNGGVQPGDVTDVKNAAATLEATAKANGDPETARQAQAAMQNVSDLQNADMNRIRAATAINKADALAQLHTAYASKVPDAVEGPASYVPAKISVNDLANAKTNLARAQVAHLTADRELQGKLAEYDALRDRYMMLMDQDRMLKNDISRLQDAHDLPLVEPPTPEIPLVVRGIADAQAKLQTALNSRPAAEQELDAAEGTVTVLQKNTGAGSTALQNASLPVKEIVHNAMRTAVANANRSGAGVQM